MTQNSNKDRLIAAGITFIAVLIILLFLFWGGMTSQRVQLAEASIPELMTDDEDEELFIEPDLLKEQGEEDAVENDAPAPAEQGEPEQLPEDNNKLVVPGDNPKPAPQIEKKITQKEESSVKATNPPATKEEPSKISSSMANKFSGKNGTPGGKTGSSGSGGDGLGITGKLDGREFKGCPAPDVALRHKTTVVVSITVNADGQVISANASGSADPSVRKACEQAALRAKWSAKKGASDKRGTITFTITPKTQ